MARREKLCYCPFGCHEADAEFGLESQFDVNGYCIHLAGFLNVPPDRSATGRMFEKLEAVHYPVRDERGEPILDEKEIEYTVDVEKLVKDDKTGEEISVSVPETRRRVQKVPRLVHSGLMRVSGKHRDKVLETDVVVTPEQLQKLLTWTEIKNGVEIKHVPRLGIPTRVYRKDAKTDVHIKPQDEEPGLDLLARIEDKRAELAELQADAAERDKRRKSSGDDEEAAAEVVTKKERRKMGDDMLVGAR